MSELITDEIVEAAADGVMLDIPVCALCRDGEPCAQCRRDAVNYARLALEAAAPLIAARALREFADGLQEGKCGDNFAPMWCETCRAVEEARETADQIEQEAQG